MADTPLAQALEWVREAGAGTLAHFRSEELIIDTKTDGSPVTRADHEAEALLRQRITEAFPDDAIHGEEQDDEPGSSGLTWVIDPIDGTKAFSHGVGTFSNLLALTDEDGPVFGVINLPALGEILWAVRGEGCWINGTARDHRTWPKPFREPTPLRVRFQWVGRGDVRSHNRSRCSVQNLG